MLTLMVIVFLLGYLAIALEHPLQINKAGTALVTGVLLWVIYITMGADIVPIYNAGAFEYFLANNPAVLSLPLWDQCTRFITDVQILEQLGEISETLFFLIGAMTIVELIDVHGGFAIITNRIKTRRKTVLLWQIAFITFFMSAILDNMTTSIVMVMLIRKLIANYKERWVFASMIIIAANSGGAWSPIGDITTIMLWVKGNVTTTELIPALILPCIVSVVIPMLIASRLLRGIITQNAKYKGEGEHFIGVTRQERMSIFFLGVGCLVFVPVFKTVTHLPPFMGIMLALGIMWIYTELMYSRKVCLEERYKHRVPQVLKRIDIPTVLFFLGILLAVGTLQMTGILGAVAAYLDKTIHNVYIINLLIGLLSAVVDNVPLVAGAMGMYPLVDPMTLGAAADPAYMANFLQYGIFWQFLAYCAGVGGSILIIGSVAGVVVMGIERISFIWYLKNISLMALCGYLAGAAVYILQVQLFM